MLKKRQVAVYKAKLEIFPVYTSFEHISVVHQTLKMWVCVVYRSPLLMKYQMQNFYEIAELFEILVIDKRDYYYFVSLTFTLIKMMIQT